MLSYHPRPFVESEKPYGYPVGWRAAECLDPRRLAECMAKFVWSPCLWRDGVRGKESFIGARWCVLDFDSGAYTLNQALRDWFPFTHVIGTTKSHQKPKVKKSGTEPPCDRFRVAVLWDNPVTSLVHFEHAMRILQPVFRADKTVFDGARLYYPCRHIVSAQEGDTLELSLPPAPRAPRAPLPDPSTREGQRLPRRVLQFLATGYAPDGRNVEVFYAANRLVERGWSDDEIFAAISAATDLDEKEIIETIKKAHRSFEKKKQHVEAGAR